MQRSKLPVMAGVIRFLKKRKKKMPRLVNQSENLTLKDCIERAVKKTVRINEKHKFYAVTCYFDPEAVSILAKCITEAIKEAKGQLIGFYVFIDVGAWFKYRGNKEDLIQTVCRETGLLNKMVDFIAINYNNRLFHAKSYSLISVKNKENNSDKRKGFVASTSGNGCNPKKRLSVKNTNF